MWKVAVMMTNNDLYTWFLAFKKLNSNKNFVAEKAQNNNSTVLKAKIYTHMSQILRNYLVIEVVILWTGNLKIWSFMLYVLNYDMLDEHILWIVNKRNDQFVYC